MLSISCLAVDFSTEQMQLTSAMKSMLNSIQAPGPSNSFQLIALHT